MEQSRIDLTQAEWQVMECLWEQAPRTGREAAALDELSRYFTFSGMPVASSTYWNMMLNSGDDSFGEDTLRQLGENMACLVKATRA